VTSWSISIRQTALRRCTCWPPARASRAKLDPDDQFEVDRLEAQLERA